MPRPGFLFAPGAGAPSAHPWMQRWKERLRTLGRTETFDYDYQREGRKRPDRLPQLLAAHRAALQSLRAEEPPGTPLFLIGKSMGSRVGCHLALEEKVSGVICFGYPLCAMGDPAKLRDQVLLSLGTPILFIQGTRDALCPLDLLEEVRVRMQARNELFVVADGDHSLGVAKRQLQKDGETQEQIEQRILAAIGGFVNSLTNSSGVAGVR